MADKPTVPNWANGGSATIVTPSASKRLLGFIKEKAPFGWWNWLWNSAYEWFNFLDNQAVISYQTAGEAYDNTNPEEICAINEWTFEQQPGYVQDSGGVFGSSAGQPVCDGKYLFVEDGAEIYAYERDDLTTLLWSTNYGTINRIFTDAQHVFVADGTVVRKLNRIDGTEDWNYDHLSNVRTIWADGESCYIGGDDDGGGNTVRKLNYSTGAAIWSSTVVNPGIGKTVRDLVCVRMETATPTTDRLVVITNDTAVANYYHIKETDGTAITNALQTPEVPNRLLVTKDLIWMSTDAGLSRGTFQSTATMTPVATIAGGCFNLLYDGRLVYVMNTSTPAFWAFDPLFEPSFGYPVETLGAQTGNLEYDLITNYSVNPRNWCTDGVGIFMTHDAMGGTNYKVSRLNPVTKGRMFIRVDAGKGRGRQWAPHLELIPVD